MQCDLKLCTISRPSVILIFVHGPFSMGYFLPAAPHFFYSAGPQIKSCSIWVLVRHRLLIKTNKQKTTLLLMKQLPLLVTCFPHFCAKTLFSSSVLHRFHFRLWILFCFLFSDLAGLPSLQLPLTLPTQTYRSSITSHSLRNSH